MASIICVSSLPARPTKGRPWASSSAPGPSPTKTSSARGLPSPKTIVFRHLLRRQRMQSPISARIFSSVSPSTRSAASKSVGPCATGSGSHFGAGFAAVASGFQDELAGVGLDELASTLEEAAEGSRKDRKSTRLNSSHGYISYAVFCLKKKKKQKKW